MPTEIDLSHTVSVDYVPKDLDITHVLQKQNLASFSYYPNKKGT